MPAGPLHSNLEGLDGPARPTLRLDSAAGVDSLVDDVNRWLDAGLPG